MPRISLGFSDLGWEVLTETAERCGLDIGEFVAASCRHYLARAEESTLPAFARSRFAGLPREITVDLGRAEMRALEHQADRRGVPVEALIRHAAIALIADVESGRVAAELAENAPDEPAPE